MRNIQYFFPIENLNIDKEFSIGNIKLHPNKDCQNLINSLETITKKTKNTDEQKKKFIVWHKNDIKANFGKFAFIEINQKIKKNEKLIPDNTSEIYEKVKEALAVLYLIQLEIVRPCSIESQKFGIKNEINRSLNFIMALEGNLRSTYSRSWHGIISDFSFTEKEIDNFCNRPIYCFFNKLLKTTKKTEMEKRIISSIIWFYDSAHDFSYVNRFIKLTIALEVLFTSGFKDQKSYRLSRLSTLISHLYIYKDINCLCPILESKNFNEYIKNTKKLNLPGMCSAFWNMYEWYQIRNNIVHDALRVIDKRKLDSFEWTTNDLITTTVRIVKKNKIEKLSDFENFLEVEYSNKIKSKN